MNIGLKLWSINTESYLKEAQILFKKKIFDYIELYIVPNTIDTISKWKKINYDCGIPFALHAPHFMHGINLANSENEKFNIEIFKEVECFSQELNSEYTIIHLGMSGSIDESIRQLQIIKPNRILVENKPFYPPLAINKKCVGSEVKDILKVINAVGCGFCLDIGHAICAANSLKINPYEFLKDMNKLNPYCYHLSDNFIDSELDNHLHFGAGNYDFKKILSIINLDKNIAIETIKNSKANIDDFVEDVLWLKKLK